MAEFIVAIELGSSKITGIAGKKNLDGSISVLAVSKATIGVRPRFMRMSSLSSRKILPIPLYGS